MFLDRIRFTERLATECSFLPSQWIKCRHTWLYLRRVKVDITLIHQWQQKTQNTTSEHFNKLQLTQLYMVSKYQSFVTWRLLSNSVFHYVTDKEMEKLLLAAYSGANRLMLKLIFLRSFLLRVFWCTKHPFMMLSVVCVRSLCPSALMWGNAHVTAIWMPGSWKYVLWSSRSSFRD